MSILLNPTVISIILLSILCLKKVNVLLAIIISTIVAGLISGMNIENIMKKYNLKEAFRIKDYWGYKFSNDWCKECVRKT